MEAEDDLLGVEEELKMFLESVMSDIGTKEFTNDVVKIQADLMDIENKQSELDDMFDEIDGYLEQYRCNLDRQRKYLEGAEQRKTEEVESIYIYNYGKDSQDKENESLKVEEDIYSYRAASTSIDRIGGSNVPVAMETDQSNDLEVIDLSAADEDNNEKTLSPLPLAQTVGGRHIDKPSVVEGMKLLGRRRSNKVWYEGTCLCIIKDPHGQVADVENMASLSFTTVIAMYHAVCKFT